MNYTREKEALSASGASSMFDGQRSFGYSNSEFFSLDLGLSSSTLSTGCSSVKPVKSAKNYLNDIQQKFAAQPDPKADLKLLRRHRQTQPTSSTVSQAITAQENEIPQIFKKMKSVSSAAVVPENANQFRNSVQPFQQINQPLPQPQLQPQQWKQQQLPVQQQQPLQQQLQSSSHSIYQQPVFTQPEQSHLATFRRQPVEQRAFVAAGKSQVPQQFSKLQSHSPPRRNVEKRSSQPFSIANHQPTMSMQQMQPASKKGFFEQIFSSSNSPSKTSIQQPRLHPSCLTSLNDVEARLVSVRDDLKRKLTLMHTNAGEAMKQQIDILLDLTERVLREYLPHMLSQLVKIIAAQKQQFKAVLTAQEFIEIENSANELESLTSHKSLLMRVQYESADQGQVKLNEMNNFQNQAQNYAINQRGYAPTKHQLDQLYNEAQMLNLPQSSWLDFIAKRI